MLQLPLNLRSMFDSLCYIPEEAERRAVMQAMNRTCPANKQLLQEYVDLKNAVAMSCGAKNYAQYNMYNSLYGQARAVDDLLKRSVKCYSPLLREYMKEAVAEREKQGGSATLPIWDEQYYICKVVNRHRQLHAAVGHRGGSDA